MLKIAVSACLLGHPVRYDGKAKPCPAVQRLAPDFELIPFCPECGCGLGCPRDPMNLVETRLLTVTTGFDHTERLEHYAKFLIARLLTEGVAGFILKSRSPSCGIRDTPQYDRRGGVTAFGPGVFSRILLSAWPGTPACDENTLPETPGRFFGGT